jgi:hypothetical protein
MTVIDVITDGIRTHAGRVDAVADMIYDARSAAGEVSLRGEAYGLLCSPIIVPILGTLEMAGLASIAASGVAVAATADALRAMAGSLDIVDGIASNLVEEAGQ